MVIEFVHWALRIAMASSPNDTMPLVVGYISAGLMPVEKSSIIAHFLVKIPLHFFEELFFLAT